MPPVTNRRYDQVQVQRTAGAWTTLTPEGFMRIPLNERVQLILEKKLRFLANGAEIKPFEALRED
jgi:hypothetical protein